MKQCRRCKQFFPATHEHFYHDKSKKDGFTTLCKTCKDTRLLPLPPVPDGYKRCPKCKEVKPIDCYHKDRSQSDGLTSSCKRCKQKPLKRIPVSDGYKRCYACKQEFPATTEYFDKGSQKYGLSGYCKPCDKTRQHKYAKQNRTKINERQNQNRAANREYTRAQGRKYHALYKEKHNARWRAYQKRNRQQLIERRRLRYTTEPERREKNRLYRLSHLQQYNTHARNRYALEKNAPGTHTPQDVQRIFEAQQGKCYYCKKTLTKYHVDHVIPITRGGSNDPSNLVVTCPTCNLRKNNKLPHEWIEGGRLL